MSVFMQPIFTQTVGAGGATSVTFNNIPQGFTDLKIVVSARSTQPVSTGGYAAILRPNGATTNLSGTQLFGDSSTIGSNRWLDAAYININPSDFTANTFGNTEVYVTSYTSGNFKAFTTDSVIENNAASSPFGISSGLFRNTAPITSFTIVAFSGSFVQNSTFTLYGISNTYDTAAPTAPTIGTITDQAGFASVAFTRATNDQAESYVVTSSPSGSTTYGAVSPIVTPAVLNTSYTYQVASVNSLGTSASSASAALTTFNSYASIATATATGSESSITFTNIPQGYKHLEIRAHLRCTGAGSGLANFVVRFNGDGGINYNYSTINGNRSGVPSQSTAFSQAQAYIGTFVPQASATTNAFGGITATVLDYASTSKIKTVKSIAGGDIVSSGNVSEWSALWNSVAPITSMTFYTDGNFANYSNIALYGIA